MGFMHHFSITEPQKKEELGSGQKTDEIEVSKDGISEHINENKELNEYLILVERNKKSKQVDRRRRKEHDGT
jgi:hypothetical protein